MTWKKILEAIIMEIIMRKKAIAIGQRGIAIRFLN